ncbi:HAD family hydrolase [Enterococcus sp. JM4C]|uniref:Cof-type HAD-IIB family hydrolase n=1 Tax=Candidatus Enterococcus huntleyi TaxID=1857217 RepID=UPI00137B463A|nr:Cof-type HAD-IIB family hydrolase [Enterococcus sp. JM4C]KAF1297485.1 HAD family hydrolase [Enterococcus sp. JM4C]
MSNYRAVAFFDLDGTLLDAQSNVTTEVASAMSQLKKNQVLPVIATGRTEIEILKIKQQTGITSNIVMNGSFIRVDGEPVYSSYFTEEECQRMYDLTTEQGHLLSYYNEEHIWCTGHNQTLVDAYNFIHSEVPPIQPLGFKEQPVKMLLVLSQSGDEVYHEAFPEMTFYRNGPYSIDIVKKGISKGTGVSTLMDVMNLTGIPTYGFGDGPNDFALLEACDHKIAMGNAVPELKEISTFVSKKNTEGGIVHALKHFDLL